MNKPVAITVFMTADHPFVGETVDVLEKYRAANSKYIVFEYTDPTRSIERAKELEAKYHLGEKEGVVVLDAGADDYKVVQEFELADVDPGDEATGREPTIKSFKVERVITTAMLDLIEGRNRRTYYVV